MQVKLGKAAMNLEEFKKQNKELVGVRAEEKAKTYVLEKALEEIN